MRYMEHIPIIIRKFASEPKTIEAMAQLVKLLERVNDSSVKDNAVIGIFAPTNFRN